MKLFRVGGISLEVHATFLLLPALLAWLGFRDFGWLGIVVMWWSLVLIYTCVVLHEFGHALAARRLGVPVNRILLLPIGGMALMGRLPRDPATELLIVAAGPLVNFVIAGLCLLALGGVPEHFGDVDPLTFRGRDLLHFLLAANLMLGVFNLIPAFPMDGGRLLRALLAIRLGYLRATGAALLVGRIVAVVAIGFALWHGNYMLTVLFAFILLLGDLEYTQLQREEAESKILL